MSTTSQPKVTLVRGSIWTGLRHVESMAIRDGVVVALGQEADDLANSPASHTATLDLGQSVVMPGFRDGHVHPLIGGRERNSLDLSGTSSAQEALTSIRAYAEANPDETWIQGGGYDPTHFDGGIAEASILDTACAERPVLLISTDHHMAWVNTKAMQLAGIDSKTLDPALGSIPRYGDNSPMGTLLEWGAIALVTDLAPNPTREDDLASMSIGMRELSSAGIVWAQDAAIGTKDADLYVDAAKQGILSSRINLAWRLEPDRWISQEDGIVNRSTAMSRDVELVDTLSANTVKFFADGVIEGGAPASYLSRTRMTNILTRVACRTGLHRASPRLHAITTTWGSRSTFTPLATEAYEWRWMPSNTPSPIIRYEIAVPSLPMHKSSACETGQDSPSSA